MLKLFSSCFDGHSVCSGSGGSISSGGTDFNNGSAQKMRRRIGMPVIEIPSDEV